MFHRRAGEIGHDLVNGTPRQSSRVARFAAGNGLFSNRSQEISRRWPARTIRLSNEGIVLARSFWRRTEMARARIQKLSAAEISRDIRAHCFSFGKCEPRFARANGGI